MIHDRRSFLRVGSLLVCGAALRPQSLLALGEKTLGVLSFDATELKLLDFVSSYSSVVRLTGASVLGHFRPESNSGLRVLVQVDDFVKAADALLHSPFNKFYAKENSISFVAQNSGHVIENLSAGDFARRVSQLGGKDNVAFAHDALSYDPIAKQLDDPLGALNGNEIRLINRPTKTTEALAVAMRGTGDAKTALMTPLISSVIKPALGMTAKQAIGEFDRVREIFGQSYSDAGVWLYVVLGKQVKKDTRGWIDAALLEDVHWREAFDTASKIEVAFESPELKSQA